MIEATQFSDPAGRILESAALLAAEVVKQLKQKGSVQISFVGLRGVSSSYFNAMLLTVAEAHGVDALKDRVTFHFSSDALKSIFQRSFDAVVRSISAA